MPKYRKKPVVIEAVQWTGENCAEIDAFLDDTEETEPGGPIIIETLEGDMTARVGDWIIRGVQGEVYPCKDSIFRETYEAVPDVG